MINGNARCTDIFAVVATVAKIRRISNNSLALVTTATVAGTRALKSVTNPDPFHLAGSG